MSEKEPLKLKDMQVFRYNAKTVSGTVYQAEHMTNLPDRCGVYLTNEDDPDGSKMLIGWADNIESIPMRGVFCDIEFTKQFEGIGKLYGIAKVDFIMPVIDNAFLSEIYCLESV